MNNATKLGAYILGLAAVFGGAVGVGNIAGPAGAETDSGGKAAHAGHGRAGEAAPAAETIPGGLQISQDGYTLSPQTTSVAPDRKVDFRFSVTGPDGAPVTRFVPQHGKKVHFILARRDLSGFQHLHPVEIGKGVWSVSLTLPEAGAYRAFVDVKPEGVAEGLTLGADLTAPGDYTPDPLPPPEPVARVDGGYEVRLAGALRPGETSKLTLTVSKDGRPVTDLQPYLEAYGHLVALRSGDLAYLHVHPDGEPGDGKTEPGPGVTFYAEVPSSGTYRLFLDFQHGNTVRTAEFTAVAGPTGAAPAPAPSTKAEDDHATHAH